MPLLTVLAASVVGLVFGWGAAAKLMRFPQWQEALRAYRLPIGVTRAASLVVPVAELTVVLLLILGRARAGAALTLALLSIFSLALLSARLSQGDRLPCGCFGRATPHDYRLLIARNAVLASLAAMILIDGRDRLLGDITHPASVVLLPLLLVVVGLSVVVWLGRELSATLRRQ